jgi:hypothetical protein
MGTGEKTFSLLNILVDGPILLDVAADTTPRNIAW